MREVRFGSGGARSRLRSSLLARVWLPATAVVVWLAAGAAAEEPEKVILASFSSREQPHLCRVRSEAGKVRFWEDGTVIAELPEGKLGRFRELFPDLVVVDTLTPGKVHRLVFPEGPSAVDSLARYGKVMRVGSAGAFLVAVEESLEERLRPLVFAMIPLPEEAEPTATEQGPGPSREVLSGLEKAELSAKRLAVARSVANQVSIDSIMATVHFVSFDDSAGVLRSRFSVRDDAVWMAHLLHERLRVAMRGVGADSLHAFTFRYGGVDYTLFNVVGRIPGRVPGSGTLVVCAHYDSEGARTVYEEPGRYWNWRTDPAPGADDNGSGIASVLECARVLSRLRFDFDIEFVLFCGEEQFLFGSRAYTDVNKALGSNIIATLNFDMHAFRGEADSTFLRTNLSSEWLSNHVLRISDALYDSIGLRVGVTMIDGVSDASDHSSFWSRGYDAVHFFEHSHLPPLYPYYHTIQDTEEKLNYDLSCKVAKLGAASVAYFAETEEPWDLEVLVGDVEFRIEESVLPVSRATSGEIVRILPSFHNIGGATGETLSVHVRVYDGAPGAGGVLLGERLIESSIPSGGSPSLEPFGWFLEEGDVGKHTIYLVVDAGQGELNVTNNVACRELTVDSERFDVRYSFVFPNPVRREVGTARLRFFLTNDADGVEVEVYDVSGRRVGGCKDGSCGRLLLEPGDENEISLEAITSDFELAAGIYAYRLKARGRGVEKTSFGRFAVVR